MTRDEVLEAVAALEASARVGMNDDDMHEAELAELAHRWTEVLMRTTEADDLWGAVEAALNLGRVQGNRERVLFESVARISGIASGLNSIDGTRGRRVHSAAARGGRKQGQKNRQAPPDDVLQREVDAYREQGESLTNARRRVAARHGLSLTTIRNHTT